MARVTGLEPATSGVTGRRSNQLSYTPAAGGGLPFAQSDVKHGPGPPGQFRQNYAWVGSSAVSSSNLPTSFSPAWRARRCTAPCSLRKALVSI